MGVGMGRERGRGVSGRLREYLLHARLPAFRKKAERSKEIVRQALAAVPGVWGLSFSGGKDSTALLHLCLEAGWRGPVLHFRFRETPEENEAFVRRVTEELGLALYLLDVPGAWDVYERTGSFFVSPGTPEEKKAVREMLRAYKETVNRYVEEEGWVGQFLGMRKGESRRRLMILTAKGGPLYQTRDRTAWTCCPLADWNGRDVWAYLLSRNLPYLPRYETAEDPERERSEVTWLASSGIWRHGQGARLKRERPEEFKRLAARWPDLEKYV